MNLYPDKYRGVSVTSVDTGLDIDALREHFVGRSAYFKTRYAVVSGSAGTAIVRVHTSEASEPDQLFLPIVDLEMLATADETAVVLCPEIDTGIPSELARAAREQAPEARAVVVHGRYEHISFIIDPQPLQVAVREVVPPRPAKLVDQAARILAVREDLPPVQLIPDVVDLSELARANPAEHYLLPCRGSGFDPSEADGGAGSVAYLDEHPPEDDWVMLGCSRSQQIHGAFYDREAPQVNFCPLEREPSPLPTLTKCCLQDDEIVTGNGFVSVPWGSSLERVSQALDELVRSSTGAG